MEVLFAKSNLKWSFKLSYDIKFQHVLVFSFFNGSEAFIVYFARLIVEIDKQNFHFRPFLEVLSNRCLIPNDSVF